MKAGQSLYCLFWAILYCILYLVSASDEDLMDFDFTDLKEIDWNYDTNDDNGNETTVKSSLENSWHGQGHGHGTITFNDDDDDDNLNENKVHPFDWREKILRNALSKALTNKALRQKFVEVMPILRVLTRQQRLALSALISAQINAKKGQELKLEQVRMMFGDDKKLLIPIVYDIARLVSDSARKYLNFSYDVLPAAKQQQQQQRQTKIPEITRRKLDLVTSEELNDDDVDDVGALPSVAMPASNPAATVDSSLEDFFGEIPDDVLDPQSINEALQSSDEKKLKSKTQRARRNAEFVHKLIRSIPISVNEEELQNGAAGRTYKLNTTSFVLPNNENQSPPPSSASSSSSLTTSSSASTILPTVDNSPSTSLSYQEIEDLAFASLNGSEINLTSSANATENEHEKNEPLPNPEELIAGPRYRINNNNNKVRLIRPKMPPAVAKRKRVQVQQQQQQQSRPHLRPQIALPSSLGAAAAVPAPTKKCERFTASMCIRTDDYPLDQIMGSIRRHKNAMTALLAEYHDKPSNLDFSDEFEDFSYNKRRREDETNAQAGSGGSMCQSIVRYARPQKARSASGEWKYIVNTGQHTQTLRLEKCSHPQESCSYLAHNYRSHCAQIYNYHRLLSWDKTRGLHVDIFKVPTCCSCQIDGYRQQFPPLDTIKSKDFSPAYNPEVYSTINEELDYNDEEDEDDLGGFQYTQHKKEGSKRHGFNTHTTTNELQLGSQHVRTKVYAPNPTVGSYLTPPGSNEYDTNYAYNKATNSNPQHHQHHHHHRNAVTASSTTTTTRAAAGKGAYNHNQLARRRPYKSLNHGFDGESRADLEISPSETHTDKEVNIYGSTIANDKTRQVQQKRKRIYSVPHTATTNSISSSSSSGGSSPITTTADFNASSVSSNGHGYGYEHGFNTFNGRNGYGQSIPLGTSSSSGSTTTTTTYQTSATSPSYYTPGIGKNIIRTSFGNNVKSKPRFRFTSTNIPNPYIRASASPSSSSSSLPTTEYETHYTQTPEPSSSSSSDAAYPSIYHISSIFNNSVPIGGSKRINYSYHPIIDFFENNSKRSATSHSMATTTTTMTPTYSTSITTFRSQEQIIPHKIPKYSSVIHKKLAPTSISAAVDVNGLLQYQERRSDTGGSTNNGEGGGGGESVGIGDDDTFNKLSFGSGSSGSSSSIGSSSTSIGSSYSKTLSGRVGNNLRRTANTNSEDNVWHPMLVP